jgi:hypothetical protein
MASSFTLLLGSLTCCAVPMQDQDTFLLATQQPVTLEAEAQVG